MNSDKQIKNLQDLDYNRFYSVDIMTKLNKVSRCLAELKGRATSLPSEYILMNALGLKEAQDSSAIENIVTTHDELYKAEIDPGRKSNPFAKEIKNYKEALFYGHTRMKESAILTSRLIIEIQEKIISNNAGFRKQPGTVLRNNRNEVVHTPPQNHEEILGYMADLESFINDAEVCSLDPLIKMALIHYQFETIHPFYDGNGRAGRIINLLYLVKEGILDLPVLYLSNYILLHRDKYYAGLQNTRVEDAWEEWVLYMLDALEQTSIKTLELVSGIITIHSQLKEKLKKECSFYSLELVNHICVCPYTTIKTLQDDLRVSRITADKYLETLYKKKLLNKIVAGRKKYFVNTDLINVLY